MASVGRRALTDSGTLAGRVGPPVQQEDAAAADADAGPGLSGLMAGSLDLGPAQRHPPSSASAAARPSAEAAGGPGGGGGRGRGRGSGPKDRARPAEEGQDGGWSAAAGWGEADGGPGNWEDAGDDLVFRMD